MRIFLEKAVKIAAASEEPRWLPAAGGSAPHVVTPVNCYSTLSKCKSSAKRVFDDRKRTNVTSADVLHLLFCLLFSSDAAVLLMGAQ